MWPCFGPKDAMRIDIASYHYTHACRQFSIPRRREMPAPCLHVSSDGQHVHGISLLPTWKAAVAAAAPATSAWAPAAPKVLLSRGPRAKVLVLRLAVAASSVDTADASDAR
jgi:hypothetical protein